MRNQFHGTIEELKVAVETCGLVGKWKENEQSGSYHYRARTGEVLNWWPKNGTIQIQGKNKDAFESALEPHLEGIKLQPTISISTNNKKIFIVHGHDRDARDQLELVSSALRITAFYSAKILMGEVKTIVEALEQNIYQETAFGIILMTPR